MILIEAIAEAIGFFLKGVAIILLIAAAGLVFYRSAGGCVVCQKTK